MPRETANGVACRTFALIPVPASSAMSMLPCPKDLHSTGQDGPEVCSEARNCLGSRCQKAVTRPAEVPAI